MKDNHTAASVRALIRDVPDFPKPGILFKDITPVLNDAAVFKKVIRAFVDHFSKKKIDRVAGIESRGFILGAPIAMQLGVGFIPIRKQGKLPYQKVSTAFSLEYGEAVMEMHTDSFLKGERILIVDDLLATGGTMAAACRLVEQLHGIVAGCAFLVELDFLKGRERLKPYDLFSLTRFD